jgi:cytochrome c
LVPDVQTTRPPLRRAAAALVLLVAAAAAQAGGDVPRGQQLYEARCGGCHSVAADRIGPRHAGVFGRRAGSVAGFDYSPALQRAGVVWDAQTLDRWLADPEALLPGQRMGYRLMDAAERADVIAYLATLTAAAAAAQADTSARR